MRTIPPSLPAAALASAFAFAFAAPAFAADEPIPTDAPIRSLGLFKNGLAVVERSFTAGGPGTYELTDLPEPVHGTFHVECARPFIVRVRQVEREVEAGSVRPSDPQADLAGKRVTVTLIGEPAREVSGVVRNYAAAGEPAWSRDYQDAPSRWWGYGPNLGIRSAAASGDFLILDTRGGTKYLSASQIAQITVDKEEPTTVRVKRPAMAIELLAGENAEAAGPAEVTISYLTKGLGWAPSYRVALGEGGRLTVDQNAVVKNELTDFDGAEVSLISGYPNVRFSHADDPIALQANWASFFSQVSQARGGGRGGAAIMSQTIVSNSIAPSSDADDLLPAGEAGAGADIYYHPAGKLALREGDALALRTAAGEADFTRIVQWVILDDRDEYGRPNRGADPDEGEGDPWDAVAFRNPFDFPLTTAPASIFEGGRFLGQSQGHWVNPGGQSTLPLTRALSVRGIYSESEEQGGREVVFVGGERCRESVVKGEIELANRRGEPVEAVIRRHFSGALIEADGDPGERLLSVGATSRNPRNELVWKVAVPAGETLKLTFRYKVFVRI